MKKWEYRLLHITTMTAEVIIGKLDEVGRDGWELTSVNNNWYYILKREKIEYIKEFEGD